MTKAWVLSRSMPLELYSCDRVYKGFLRHNIDTKFVDLFDVKLYGNNLVYEGEKLTPPDVAVIPNAIRVPRLNIERNEHFKKSLAADIVDSYNAIQILKSWNTLFVNDLDAHADASDKWITYNKLVNAGISMPRTCTFPIRLDHDFTRQDLKDIILNIVGEPFVVKRAMGFNGLGVELCNSIDDLESVCKKIWRDYPQPLIIQEYMGYSTGMIVTVGIVGDEIFPVARVGDPTLPAFKADIYAGRLQIAYKTTPELYDMCMKAKEALGLDYVRFDMMMSEDGELKVIEVNSPGGYNVISLSHNMEFGFKMVDCALSKLKDL